MVATGTSSLFVNTNTRREFLRDLGVSAAAVPFLMGLPGLAAAKPPTEKQRLIFMFSPNGTVPWEFWPDEQGEEFKLKRILAPLEAYRDKTLILHGVSNKVRGGISPRPLNRVISGLARAGRLSSTSFRSRSSRAHQVSLPTLTR